MTQESVAAPALGDPRELIDEVIACHDGNPRLAIAALLEIARQLEADNRMLRRSASPCYARRPPARPIIRVDDTGG